MKVNGANGVGSTVGPGRARPAGEGQGFRLPAAEAAAGPVQTARATGLSGVMSVDALLALQDVGGPLERKRRAVRRAGHVLDILDEVKLAMVSGELNAGSLARLQDAVRQQREQTDDPKLEAVLNEIETRAEVEIAKLEQAKAAL